MGVSRRVFLRGAAAAAALMALPRALLAWPEKAFKANSRDDVMAALFGTTEASDSDAVVLSAPDIAENGRVVPVSVSSTLDGVESISIIVEENPSPLAASFDLGPGAAADVSMLDKIESMMSACKAA